MLAVGGVGNVLMTGEREMPGYITVPPPNPLFDLGKEPYTGSLALLDSGEVMVFIASTSSPLPLTLYPHT